MKEIIVTGDEARAVREKREVGLYSAKHILLAEKTAAAIEEVESLEDVKVVLRAILKLVG